LGLEAQVSKLLSSEQRLLNSIKENRNFSLSLKQYENCPSIPKFYFYKCLLQYGDFQVIGTGESHDKSFAQLKAIGECFERLPIVDRAHSWVSLGNEKKESRIHLNSSNGVAFHSSLDKAVLNAKRELIERHTILDSWLYGRNSFLVNFPVLSRVQTFFNCISNGVKQNIYFFKNDFELPVFCTHLYSEDFQFFGFGADLDKSMALNKSLLESWRFLWEYRINAQREFRDGDDLCLMHYYHWLNSNEKESPFGSSNIIDFAEINSLQELSYEGQSTFYCDLDQRGIDGFVAKVEAPSLINLWTGALKEDRGIRKAGDYHPIA